MPEDQNIDRRASWGTLAFVMLYPSVLTWAYFVALAGHEGALRQAAYGIGKLIQFGFPAFFVVIILRQRIHWVQLSPVKTPSKDESSGRPQAASGTWIGLGFGVAIFAAMLGLYYGILKPAGVFEPVVEVAWEKVHGLGIDSLAKYAALATFYALAHSLLEEYYWRWFVFGQLRHRLEFVPSLLLSSFGFMAHHVILLGTYFGWTSPLAWLFSLSVAVGGLFWGWLYERTGSLFGPWLSHLLVDAGIFWIGYELLGQRLAGS